MKNVNQFGYLLAGAFISAGILGGLLTNFGWPTSIAQRVASDYPCDSFNEKVINLGFDGSVCAVGLTSANVAIVDDIDKGDVCTFQLTQAGSDAWIVRAFNGDYIQMPHPTKGLIRQSTLWDSCHAYRAAHTPPAPDERPYTS
jgi:hypothetical protein